MRVTTKALCMSLVDYIYEHEYEDFMEHLADLDIPQEEWDTASETDTGVRKFERKHRLNHVYIAACLAHNALENETDFKNGLLEAAENGKALTEEST